jgi:hypothetical protein
MPRTQTSHSATMNALKDIPMSGARRLLARQQLGLAESAIALAFGLFRRMRSLATRTQDVRPARVQSKSEPRSITVGPLAKPGFEA